MRERLLERLRRPVTPTEAVAILILIFVTANFLYGAVMTKKDPPSKNDFTSYYVAAHVLKAGMSGALYYPEPVGSLLAQASTQHPWIDVAVDAGVPNPNYYLYPPLFALAVLPLALLPYGAAFGAWLAANVIFLALALWIFLRDRRPGMIGLAACVLFAGTFYPVWHHLKIGQSSLLLLLLLSATLALLLRGRDGAAGLCLSAAILLKLTPALLLGLLVVRRRWRAVGWSLGGVALLTLLSAAATGWQDQLTYYLRMVPLLSAGTAFYPNQSLNGFLTRLTGYGDYRLADLSHALLVPRVGATLVGLLLVGWTLYRAWRRAGDRRAEAFEDGFAAFVLASLLVSPISWEHHYVLALLPAWILAARWARTSPSGIGSPVLAGLALVLTGSYVGVKVFEKFGPGPLGPVLSSAALLGGALLWWLFTRESGPAGGRAGSARSTAALLTLMAIFAGGQFLLKVAEYNTSFHYGDFTSYYIAASALQEGKGEILYAPDTPDMILAKAESPSPWRDLADRRGVRDANFYLYPPFFATITAPIAWLTYDRAHDLWYLVNLLALAGFVAWFIQIGRRSGGRTGMGALTQGETAGAVILTALFWPALFTFGAGQANYWILLMVFGGLLAAERRRNVTAGFLLAAATAIKLTPGLLVAWYLMRRRYALVAWAAIGFSLLALLGAASVGWDTSLVYATEMVPLLSRGCAHWVNQSLSATLSRIAGADMFDWSLAPESILVRSLAILSSLGLVGILAWLTRPGGSRETGRLQFSLVLVTSLFISPISWVHHAVLSLPALFFLVRDLDETRRLTLGRAALIGIAFTLFGIYLRPFGFLRAAWLTPLASYHLLGQVILWLLIASQILWSRRQGSLEARTP